MKRLSITALLNCQTYKIIDLLYPKVGVIDWSYYNHCPEGKRICQVRGGEAE